MDADRIKGKVKEIEGKLQQKWGKTKDEGRGGWEHAKDRADDAVDGAKDPDAARREDDELTETSRPG